MGAGAPAHLAFPPLTPNDPARFAALSRRNTSGRSSSPPILQSRVFVICKSDRPFTRPYTLLGSVRGYVISSACTVVPGQCKSLKVLQRRRWNYTSIEPQNQEQNAPTYQGGVRE